MPGVVARNYKQQDRSEHFGCDKGREHQKNLTIACG